MSSATDLPAARRSGRPEDREPGHRAPEAGRPAGEPALHVRERIDDRLLMALLIPGFGVGIAHGVSLFGDLGPSDPAWWGGHAWFVGGSALIYGANRTLLFAGRTHADWFSRPVARLVLLATGIVFGTLPPTLLMLHFWSALSGVPLGDAPRTVTLVNVACVLFVTWLYETLFLIRERVDDQVHLAALDAARSRAELDALRAQVDPHFLFNALNTLTALIEPRPAEAVAFVEHLARVYRSSLDLRGRAVVPLPEELELAAAYAGLVRIRFGEAVQMRMRTPERPERWLVPPGASQILLENAIRHNAVDPDAPLCIELDATDGALAVSHPRRPRPPAPGSGLGLAGLDARSRAATGRPIRVEPGEVFRVTVPMVSC